MNNPYFNLLKIVWYYGKEWRKSIVAYYVAFILAHFFISLSPYAFGQAINTLQTFQPGQLKQVVLWLLGSTGTLLIFWIFHGPARIIECNVSLKIKQSFRHNCYIKLVNLPLKWHQNHHSGNIITRINRSAEAIFKFAQSQFYYIKTIVKFSTAIGFLLWISVPIGLISLCSAVLVMTVVVQFDKRLVPLYRSENNIENHVGSVLFDYVSNMTTILTLRLGKLTSHNLFQRMMSVWPYFKKKTYLNEMKWFSMMILFSLVQTSILIGYVVYCLKVEGQIMIGLVVMIFRYQWEISEVFDDLSSNYSEIVKMNTDAQSVLPILEEIQSLDYQVVVPKKIEKWKIIKISNLHFSHGSEVSKNNMFNDINLEIKRGEKIALIGTSGGGKSTMMNLLSGLYQSQKVQLSIDSQSFESLSPLHFITTLIPQDPEIFENTIEFNITMDLPTHKNDIEKVVDLASFTDILKCLPQGLKTDVREKGLNLSVGQKQRLALARGLFAARYSSLILMDEPTSSVDLPTERKIISKIIKEFKNSTVIISLHRLHLLPSFDSIIMIEGSRIVARGNVEDLLNKEGPVKNLWLAYQHNPAHYAN